MKHKASSDFWRGFNKLSIEAQEQSKKQFSLLKENPNHPSLRFKKIPSKNYYSVRASLGYRALAIKDDDYYIWFWIGPHSTYDKLIK